MFTKYAVMYISNAILANAILATQVIETSTTTYNIKRPNNWHNA